MSKESDAFVHSIKAAFPYMSKDAVALYQGKLERWKLTREQWTKALDELISIETDGNPPQISVVFAVLQNVQRKAMDNNLGRVFFRVGDVGYVIPTINIGGEWLSRKTREVPRLPAGAKDIKFEADYAAQDYREAEQSEMADTSDLVEELAEQMEVPF